MAKKERHKRSCVLQNDRQSWSIFPSAARASWPGLEQQNTEPLAWPQRNTSLLIQTKNKRGREMEVCSASGAVCRCLIMVYTRCRSGFTAGHSWDETAGHGASTAASSCTLWLWRSGGWSWRLQGHTVWMTLRPFLDVNAQVGHKTVHAAANYTS